MPRIAPKTNKVILYSPLKKTAFGLSEIKIYTGPSTYGRPVSYTATSRKPEGATIDVLFDGKDDKIFYVGDGRTSTQGSGDQALHITFSTSSVKQITRILLGDLHFDQVEVYVQVGLDVFRTVIGKKIFGSFSILVPQKGVYPSGTVVMNGYNKQMYKIENGLLRPMSSACWEKSGHPGYFVVYDQAILELPKGQALTEPLESVNTNYLWLYGAPVGDLSIHVIDPKSPRTLKKLPIKGDHILAQMAQRESVIVDGDPKTFAVCDRHPGIYISLPSYPNAILHKFQIILPLGYKIDPQESYRKQLSIKMQFNGLYFEFSGERTTNFLTEVNFQNFIVHKAIDFVPRAYVSMVKASFDQTQTERLSDIATRDCPQRCDYKKDCVAYSVEENQLVGCILYLSRLFNPKPSATTKTYIASPVTGNYFLLDTEGPFFENFPNLPQPLPEMAINSFRQMNDDLTNFLKPFDAFYVTNSDSTIYEMNMVYLGTIKNHQVLSFVDKSYCFPERDGYIYKNKKCYQVIQSTPQDTKIVDKTIFIKMFALTEPLTHFSADFIGLVVRFATRGSSIILKHKDEGAFIVHATCPSCENQYRFESLRQPGAFLCATSSAVKFSAVISGVSCDWTIEYRMISVALRSVGIFPMYLGSDITGKFRLQDGPFWMRSYASPRLKKAKQYRTDKVTTIGAQTFKTIPGTWSTCSESCDDEQKCVGYTLIDDQGGQGCHLLSSRGKVQEGVSGGQTVLVATALDRLSNDIPKQIELVLYCGKPRTLTTGMGIHIHLIDSGVTDERGSANVYDDLLLTKENTYEDKFGHGNVIANIIRGPKGIAPGVSLHNLKIFDTRGETTSTKFIHAVLNVLQRATNNFKESSVTRPTILSISAIFPKNKHVDCIIEAAYRMGVYVVIAAGNEEGVAYDDWNSMSPAASRFGIVVGSYDSDFNIRYSKHGRYVDIYAQGNGFVEKQKSKTLGGTSLAAPQVAAVLAKILDENPEYISLAPVYAYTALKSAAIERNLVYAGGGTQKSLILTGSAPRVFNRHGEWAGNWKDSDQDRAKFLERSCTLASAVQNAAKDWVKGHLVASPLNPSAVQDLVSPFVNGLLFNDYFDNEL